MATDFTKKMLKTIREGIENNRKYTANPLIVEDTVSEPDNFLTRSKILMEEAEGKIQKKNLTEAENKFNDEQHGNAFPITKSTPQFGDVRVSQEEAILKTIGEQVKFDDNSLLYYPDADDLVFNGEIPSMNTSFQFRFNDPSEGLYIWCDALPLNEKNLRTIGKVNDAYLNWHQSLVSDSDLFEKLKKVSERNNN